jgi:hypothetical protein
MSRYLVKHTKDSRVACRGWRGAPGSGFIWSPAGLRKVSRQHDETTWELPDWVLTWETERGASQFAAMNGGFVKSITDLLTEVSIQSVQQLIDSLGELQTWN